MCSCLLCAVCSLITDGAWLIIGPDSEDISWLIQSIVNTVHVPYFSFAWSSGHRELAAAAASSSSSSSSSSDVTLHLRPASEVTGSAFAHLIHSRMWKSFALVYEESDQLIRLKHILTVADVKMLLHQLPMSSEEYSDTFTRIKETGETNVILSVSSESKVIDALNAARRVGLLTEYNNYSIASMDLHLINLPSHVSSNISGLTVKSMMTRSLYTEEALLIDSLSLLSLAIDQLFVSDTSGQLFSSRRPVNCQSTDPWKAGPSIIDKTKSLSYAGITGQLEFDKHGFRKSFDLDVLEYSKNTFIKVT